MEQNKLYTWISGKPKDADQLSKLPIKCKGHADTLIFINGKWCWQDNSIDESAKYPVAESNWSTIECLQEYTPPPPLELEQLSEDWIEAMKREPVSFYLANILRHCTEEEMVALWEKLGRRLPKTTYTHIETTTRQSPKGG